jgi:hypothetical protein
MLDSTAVTWSFATAQTDALLITVGATQRLAVLSVKATCANSNTGDVSVRLGFATATLPTLTVDSLTGATGEFFSHGGIAHGGGAVDSDGALGGLGEDLRLTCSAATGGSLRLSVKYRMLETE